MAGDKKETIEIDHLGTGGTNIVLENCADSKKVHNELYNTKIASYHGLKRLTAINSDLVGILADTSDSGNLEKLESINLIDTTFSAGELLHVLEHAPENFKISSENIKNCTILCNNKAQEDTLNEKLGFKLPSDKFIFPPPPPAPSDSAPKEILGFDILTRPSVSPTPESSLKEDLKTAKAMEPVNKRMATVLTAYNNAMAAAMHELKTHGGSLQTSKDSVVLNSHENKPLLTGTPGGTKVHKAFLDSPISDDKKAELILTSLGLPPAPGSSEVLPDKLTITPYDPTNPVQKAVIKKFDEIKATFDKDKDFSVGLGTLPPVTKQ